MIYSVLELTEEIRRHLEERYDWVQVRGEISNFKKAPSGHAYFRLKDKDAVLECVAWRSTVIRWGGLDLGDGQEVIAGGRITIYPPRGQYQLIVSAIRPAGIGVLQQRFEELKQRLAAEGLFDSDRKKSLPLLPNRIAVITSPTGAAIRDFLKILKSCHCPVHVIVCPVLVQGEKAAGEVAEMIQWVNTQKDIDLAVLSRGGGSLEDLWAFNEEIVARAIFQSECPVMTGVGHEIDFTIADFAADVRAPTPTGAAQLICGIFDRHRDQLALLRDRLQRIMLPTLERLRSRIEDSRRALRRYHPIVWIEQQRQRLDELQISLLQAMKSELRTRRMIFDGRRNDLKRLAGYRISGLQKDLERYHTVLQSFDPAKTLARGYSICRKNGEIVKSISGIKPKDTIQVVVQDGTIHSNVFQVQEKQ